MADRNGSASRDSGIHASESGAAVYQQAHASMLHGAVQPSPDPLPLNPHLDFFYRVAERFGIPVVVLLLVLWWAKNDLVQPLLDAHFDFVRRITNAHEKQTEELSGIGEKLDTLIRISTEK